MNGARTGTRPLPAVLDVTGFEDIPRVRSLNSMNSFLREIAGGIVVMVVAAVVGVAVNAARPDGIALIQKGAVVSTAQHGEVDSTAAPAPLAEGAISVEEMKQIFDAGTAVILDARSTEEYEEGHIPGSINIPHDRIPEFVGVLNSEVSTDAHIVCYCRSPTCEFSDLLATELKVIGYQDVSIFSGGWEQWTKANYPVEKGPRQ
jgi:rhodanese-related sulfurtransferase